MRFRLSLLLAAAVVVAGAAKADTVDQYGLSVKITATGPNVGNPFAGETFTGTFTVDEQTGDVTNFSANLLNASPPFSAADLGDVATFDSTGKLTTLSFQLAIHAPDGTHSSGFTGGFTPFQVSFFLGLDPNNYFAYLDNNAEIEGGGTPVFTLLSSTSSAPEPASLSLFGIAAITAGLIGRKRFGRR